MKILVTGSSGFLGRELVSELKKKKYFVIEYSESNGKNILNRKKLAINMKGVDVVVHLAAILDNDNSQIEKINIQGTKNVVEEAIKAKVKKFIFMSSTSVYGVSKKYLDEKSEVNPIDSYGRTKYEAEQIVLNHQEEINVNVIRSALLFGANNYWRGLFKLLKKNYPLPCSGKNIFQIIYVKELVRIIILVIKKGESGEIFLAAGKEKWTLKEFVKKIKKAIGKKERVWGIPSFLAIFFGKLMSNNLLTIQNIRHIKKDRNYDISKIEKLGYFPKTNLEEAIIETIEKLK
jgi:nucleoside-diphosphate-sugar epimerase